MTQLETRTEPMVVNFGPHHPSMHGVLRLVVTLSLIHISEPTRPY